MLLRLIFLDFTSPKDTAEIQMKFFNNDPGLYQNILSLYQLLQSKNLTVFQENNKLLSSDTLQNVRKNDFSNIDKKEKHKSLIYTKVRNKTINQKFNKLKSVKANKIAETVENNPQFLQSQKNPVVKNLSDYVSFPRKLKKLHQLVKEKKISSNFFLVIPKKSHLEPEYLKNLSDLYFTKNQRGFRNIVWNPNSESFTGISKANSKKLLKALRAYGKRGLLKNHQRKKRHITNGRSIAKEAIKEDNIGRLNRKLLTKTKAYEWHEDSFELEYPSAKENYKAISQASDSDEEDISTVSPAADMIRNIFKNIANYAPGKSKGVSQKLYEDRENSIRTTSKEDWLRPVTRVYNAWLKCKVTNLTSADDEDDSSDIETYILYDKMAFNETFFSHYSLLVIASVARVLKIILLTLFGTGIIILAMIIIAFAKVKERHGFIYLKDRIAKYDAFYGLSNVFGSARENSSHNLHLATPTSSCSSYISLSSILEDVSRPREESIYDWESIVQDTRKSVRDWINNDI